MFLFGLAFVKSYIQLYEKNNTWGPMLYTLIVSGFMWGGLYITFMGGVPAISALEQSVCFVPHESLQQRGLKGETYVHICLIIFREERTGGW